MNAKHYGVPQTENEFLLLVFRDDTDNDFKFPKPFHLEKDRKMF
jgi:hypothetical protein